MSLLTAQSSSLSRALLFFIDHDRSLRSAILVSGLIFVATQLAPGAAFGAGLGPAQGAAIQEWKHVDSGATHDREVSRFGAVFDTNVSDVRLFNYRLSLNSETSKPEGNGLKFEGWSMSHSIGFRLLANERIRLWLGPDLYYASFYHIKQEGSSDNYSGRITGIGIGPRIGLNIHFPRVASFIVSAGTRYTSYMGNLDVRFGGGGSTSLDVDSNAWSHYLAVGFLFKFGE